MLWASARRANSLQPGSYNQTAAARSLAPRACALAWGQDGSCAHRWLPQCLQKKRVLVLGCGAAQVGKGVRRSAQQAPVTEGRTRRCPGAACPSHLFLPAHSEPAPTCSAPPLWPGSITRYCCVCSRPSTCVCARVDREAWVVRGRAGQDRGPDGVTTSAACQSAFPPCPHLEALRLSHDVDCVPASAINLRSKGARKEAGCSGEPTLAACTVRPALRLPRLLTFLQMLQ